MSDAIKKARAARNVLERLGKKLPGFAGYLDRELTREIDQLVRARLADGLDAARGDVAAYSRTLDLGAADKVQRLASLDKDLDMLANAIRHAGSGYAGLFDAGKVNQEQLEAVYNLEVGFVENVEAVAESASHLSEGGDAIDRLAAALTILHTRFEGREKAFKGVLA